MLIKENPPGKFQNYAWPTEFFKPIIHGGSMQDLNKRTNINLESLDV